MPAIIIVAFVAGLAWSLGAAWIGKRLVRKMRFSQPDRDLISFKLRMQYAGRTLIGGQIMLIIATAGLAMVTKGEDRDLLCAGFIFGVFLCIGARGLFSELRIGAESELEYRKLHPRADNSEKPIAK